MFAFNPTTNRSISYLYWTVSSIRNSHQPWEILNFSVPLETIHCYNKLFSVWFNELECAIYLCQSKHTLQPHLVFIFCRIKQITWWIVFNLVKNVMKILKHKILGNSQITEFHAICFPHLMDMHSAHSASIFSFRKKFCSAIWIYP